MRTGVARNGVWVGDAKMEHRRLRVACARLGAEGCVIWCVMGLGVGWVWFGKERGGTNSGDGFSVWVWVGQICLGVILIIIFLCHIILKNDILSLR